MPSTSDQFAEHRRSLRRCQQRLHHSGDRLLRPVAGPVEDGLPLRIFGPDDERDSDLLPTGLQNGGGSGHGRQRQTESSVLGKYFC